MERDDGRVLAVEFKLVRDVDVRDLKWLEGRIGDELIDAMVVTTGPEAYRRTVSPWSRLPLLGV